MIPSFNAHGNLPPGIHTATINEIKSRYANNPKRQALIKGLEILISDLQKAGCRTLYLDGSFICNVTEPADYDACWEPDGVTNTINPLLREIAIFKTERKHKYGGDIVYRAPETGLDHLEFFQKTREGIPKGIIKIEIKKSND
jgi:hypothetical protein